MEIFDLEIVNKELEQALTKVWRQELGIRDYEITFHSEIPGKCLAKVTLFLQTVSGVKTMEILVKESSEHELVVLSIANKLIPYSSPKVILYRPAARGMWLFLENVSTWIDIGGRERTNERMLDGLYEIHRVFFDDVQALLDNFNAFSVVTKETLRSGVLRALKSVDEIRFDRVYQRLFEDWGEVQESANSKLDSLDKLDFPMTVLHGSYYPNTVRGMRDEEGRIHVVAYDWQYSGIGWPQIDLALLLDRVDLIAASQGLESPSPVLLERYWTRVHEEFQRVDYDQFKCVYEICYLYRALPLIRWWAKNFVARPLHEASRAVNEITMKVEGILGKKNE
jgi:hypothetical protein